MEPKLSNIIQNTQESIEKGINYLHQHQYPNGEYCCYMGADDALVNWCIPDSNVFPTSLIVFCLKDFRGDKKVNEMMERAKGFLEYQAMNGGVWNHYTKWHIMFDICPPDIDNTCGALKALEILNPNLVAYKDILYANLNKEKLFYTWYALRFRFVKNKTYWRLALRALKNPVRSYLLHTKTECKRNDVDAIVNANVLFYLGYEKNTQAIVPYLINVILEHKEKDCDKSYGNPFTVYYFIARNYGSGIEQLEPVKIPIIERILKSTKKDGSFGDGVFDTALAISSLIDFGYQGNELVAASQFLVKNQKESGEWLRWTLYYSGKKKELCWGSEEATTAFSLEALGKFKISYQNNELSLN